MIDLTIHNIIKALPFEETTKQELLAGYDTFPDEKKFAVSKICWDAFATLEDAVEAYLQEKILQEISLGKRKPAVDLAAEVEKGKWEYISDLISGKKKDDQQLSQIRSQLEKFLQTE